ncbi:hypothetical protein N182_29965 [Sinorhizobium sp. GL2]|nr:hypothetical protein N182_29965 [Sinorhizobium sp. GL2]
MDEPEIRRERPSAEPARMKFEASVTMKLGSRVLLTRKALKQPTMTPRPSAMRMVSVIGKP